MFSTKHIVSEYNYVTMRTANQGYHISLAIS